MQLQVPAESHSLLLEPEGEPEGDCYLVDPELQCHSQDRGAAVAANDLVQARIDKEVKAEAAAVLAAMGLTVSDAVRLLLTKVAREKALPFDPLIPNETTIAAMREARAGKVERFGSVADLMADLHADD